MALIIPLLFAAVVYFLLIRPQQRQARQHAELVATLEVGDEVLTGSGIYGTLTEIDGEDISVEIADGIEVRMAKRAVVEVAVDDETTETTETTETAQPTETALTSETADPAEPDAAGGPTGADTAATADDS